MFSRRRVAEGFEELLRMLTRADARLRPGLRQFDLEAEWKVKRIILLSLFSVSGVKFFLQL